MNGTERALRASFERYGARGPNERGDYQLNCPFCEDRYGKEDSKFKLSANPTVTHPSDDKVKGGWVCWRCDARGWGGLDFLAEPDEQPQNDARPELGPPGGFVPFRGNETSIALRPYTRYLLFRPGGLWLVEIITKLGGGACLDGRFGERVVVPHVVGGVWAGFSSRAIGNQEPKYLYPRGMDRRAALWGLEWVPDTDEPLYVVEGVFDALPLFPYGVATFGKSVTPEQIALLSDLKRPLVICLDGDAWQECRALAMRIWMRRQASGNDYSVDWAHLPPTEDPGKLGWSVRNHIVQANS